jgi:hypothetical protein
MNDNKKSIELAVKEYLLPIFKQALETCAGRHQYDLKGVDNTTYGNDAWHVVRNYCQNEINMDETRFIITNRPGFVMRYGKYEIRHHRVGISEKDNIFKSFPRNAKGISNDIENQNESFDFLYDEIPNDQIIIAYMANYTDGLCALYIAEPALFEKGKIVQWKNVKEIYKIHREEVEPLHDTVNNIADKEEIKEVYISFNPNKDKKSDEE